MRLKFLRLPILLLFVFAGTTLLAQKKSATPDADAAYSAHRYYDAITLYKKGYNKEKTAAGKKLILYKIGHSYYEMMDYKEAKNWLGKAIKAGFSDAEAQFLYANVFRRTGDYDQAIVEFKKLKEIAPGDKRADEFIKQCEDAQEWMDNPTRYVVEKDPVLNSKKGDFSPAWADKRHTSLIFTSTREGSVGDNVDPITGQSYSSIWFTKQDKKSKKWMTPDIVDEGVIG